MNIDLKINLSSRVRSLPFLSSDEPIVWKTSCREICSYCCRFDIAYARGGKTTYEVDGINLTGSVSDLSNGTFFIAQINIYGDTFNGNNFPDLIHGGPGGDGVYGHGGQDTLFGDAGNDLLVGGPAKDTLIGGTGADRFAFGSITDSAPGRAFRDFILDFNRFPGLEHDRLDLSLIDADQRHAGNQRFVFIGSQTFAHYHAAHPSVVGMVRFSGGVLQANVNASLSPDFELQLHGVPAISVSDLYL